mgnify:CR=1 FL=1|jgi:hypothetical protein
MGILEIIKDNKISKLNRKRILNIFLKFSNYVENNLYQIYKIVINNLVKNIKKYK